MQIYIWNQEVFEKVKSGEWTFDQFEGWVLGLESTRYDDGYADGWKDSKEDADNELSGE